MSNRTFCVLRPPGARIRLRAPGCALIGALLLTGCNAGGSIVPPNEGFAIKVNLLCTTCDDFLDCRREPGAIAESTAPGARPPLLIYRLKEKSFWAQIATIGDYLFQLFRQKTSDERPLAIYRDDGANRRSSRCRPARLRRRRGGHDHPAGQHPRHAQRRLA